MSEAVNVFVILAVVLMVLRSFIYALIILAGILVGLATYFKSVEAALSVSSWIMTAIFTLEMLLKILAEGLHPWRYLYDETSLEWDPWNLLDMLVIVSSYLPNIDNKSVFVIRLLLVLKLFKEHPKLRVTVESFPAAR